MIDLKIIGLVFLFAFACSIFTKSVQNKELKIEIKQHQAELRADTILYQANELLEQTDSIKKVMNIKPTR